MTSKAPYLQRRGFALNFRIPVPPDLRAILGLREVTRALPTSSRAVGALMALQSAVVAKKVFADLRAAQVDFDREKLKDLVRESQEKLRIDAILQEHLAELIEQSRKSRLEVERARLQGENEGLRRAIAELASAGHATTHAVVPSATASPAPATTSPLLSKVVADFLARHHRDKVAMLKKHKAVLPLFLEIVGDKPVTAMKQADINGFLDTVQKLPPRWADECRKQGISVVELAASSHPKTLAPKSFEDTYKACLRTFLKEARSQWQDEGFPTTLTTEGNSYRGQRKEDENKQRAFTDDELRRVFNGPEMVQFRSDPTLEHQFWLPHVGLFTGARVNEICQINPQVDILQDAKSGIWYLQIDEESESDDRITKTVKNKVSKRKVPIHSRLLSLGFLEYVDRVKAEGSKLLFPAFKPGRRKASSEGEKWFRNFLRDLGLRDDTPGARLVGMHAFRHTLLHKAYNASPPLDVTPITGHRGDTDAVVAGYQGELSLENKKRILEAVPFGL